MPVIEAVHDCSDGGLLTAIAEMALAGGIGADIHPDWGEPTSLAVDFFGEGQGRYVVTCEKSEALVAAAQQAGVCARFVGFTGLQTADRLQIADRFTISLADLRAANERFFREWMEG